MIRIARNTHNLLTSKSKNPHPPCNPQSGVVPLTAHLAGCGAEESAHAVEARRLLPLLLRIRQMPSRQVAVVGRWGKVGQC